MVAAANLVILIAAEREKVVSHFQAAQATSPGAAVPRAVVSFELGAVASLESEGVIKATSDDRLYLDQSGLAAAAAKSRGISAKMLLLTALFVAALVAAARFWGVA